MPADTTHQSYTEFLDRWRRCRDCFDGGDAVKKAGERYLPKVSDLQTMNDYRAYRDRGLFFNVFQRTVEGFLGLCFRKPPEVIALDDIEDLKRDITLSDVSLEGFSKSLMQEVLTVGRAGILVDMASEDTAVELRRPYFTPYYAEEIINWRTAMIGGKRILSLVVLSERIEELEPGDGFSVSDKTRYRELRLDESGFYEVRIWERDGDQSALRIVSEYQPMVRGQRIDFIPFWFVGPTGTDPEIAKPPLLDLADVNLSHYRTSADLEHGRHWTGLPTLFAKGLSDVEELCIGGSQAIMSANTESDIRFIEFTGQGLQALEKALTEKTDYMAALGARLLEPHRRAVESAEALKIRTSGESVTVKSIGSSVSLALSKALSWALEWAGKSAAAVVALNDDYLDTEISAQDLNALIALWQSGGVSFETLYYCLSRGEITRPGVSAEQEKQSINAETPEEEM